MITLTSHIEEKFDINAFLKKEGITMYKFCKMTETPVATIYSASSGDRNIKKETFDKIMAKYEEAKKQNTN
jgi:predicted transcriptional regulator